MDDDNSDDDDDDKNVMKMMRNIKSVNIEIIQYFFLLKKNIYFRKKRWSLKHIYTACVYLCNKCIAI